jgi:hypothetical protein
MTTRGTNIWTKWNKILKPVEQNMGRREKNIMRSKIMAGTKIYSTQK